MNNLGKLKKIVVWLGVIFAANLILFALMLPRLSLWAVSVIVVQVIVVIYFVGICMALIRELREHDGKDGKLKK